MMLCLNVILLHTSCLFMADHWFMQSAESVLLQAAPVIVPIPPHHDLNQTLSQAIHHLVLHLQVILSAADLQATHLIPDLYLLDSLAHVHGLLFHLPAVLHQLVLSQYQRRQKLQEICI